MTPHYDILALALLLLWFPRQWLRLGGRKNKSRSRDASLPPFPRPKRSKDDVPKDVDDKAVQIGEEFRKKRNYIDLFRGAAGSIALVNFSFTLLPNALPETGYYLLGAIGGIAALGVLIQILRFEGRLGLFAPIFYLSGLSMGFCGPAPALFSLVLIWAVAFTLSNPEVFLGCYALLLGGFGYLFLGSNKLPLAGVACLLVLMPPMLSLLMNKSLVLSFKPAVRTPRRS